MSLSRLASKAALESSCFHQGGKIGDRSLASPMGGQMPAVPFIREWRIASELICAHLMAESKNYN